MSTTTLRMNEVLKSRVQQAADRAGTTPHNFMLEAISEKAEREDRRGDFHATADRRYAGIVASGKTIAWSEMKRYLQNRSAGKKATHPAAKKMAR